LVMNTKAIRANSVLITPNIRSIAGTKVLRREDFVKVRGEMPPEELMRYGEKHVIPPAMLRDLRRIRKSVDRFCISRGTRFNSCAYLFDKSLLNELCEKLDSYSEEYSKAADEFIRRYPRELIKWAERFPEYEFVIMSAAPRQEELRRKITFDYMVYTIEGVEVEASSQASESVEKGFSGLYGQVVNEACTLMGEWFTRPLDEDERRLSVRTVDQFRRVRDKYESLAFIDGRFKNLTNYIDTALRRCNGEGSLTDDQRVMLVTLYQSLKEPAAVHNLIDSLT